MQIRLPATPSCSPAGKMNVCEDIWMNLTVMTSFFVFAAGNCCPHFIGSLERIGKSSLKGPGRLTTVWCRNALRVKV